MNSKKNYSSKWHSVLKGIINFICLFVIIFLINFFGINFAAFYKNFKFDANQILSNKMNPTLSLVQMGEYSGEERIKIIEKTEQSSLNGLSENTDGTAKYNRLLIPKINVDAPILTLESADGRKLLPALKEGVVIYPDSALPDEKGTTVILGHSSPPIFNRGKYNTVFSLLNKLEKGDEITVYYNQEKHVYRVDNKRIFHPKDEILFSDGENKSILVLLTCWPLGTDWKRLAIEAYEVIP